MESILIIQSSVVDYVLWFSEILDTTNATQCHNSTPIDFCAVVPVSHLTLQISVFVHACGFGRAGWHYCFAMYVAILISNILSILISIHYLTDKIPNSEYNREGRNPSISSLIFILHYPYIFSYQSNFCKIALSNKILIFYFLPCR